ncbi:MAG TPA: hypothetical protein ENI60_04660, partial [Candidatus Fraserbacteria bacterium]|nr:hypothetical protein [Candidatus Fraserbacteria bacterium]
MENLLTYEVGSLAKPEWRVGALADRPITPTYLADARQWGAELGIESEPLLELFSQAPFDQRQKQEIKNWASRYALRLLERAGLDVVYDGEQQRSEMYHYPVSHSRGFEFRGLLRSFDNKYYRKAACVAKPELEQPYHTDEFRILQQYAEKPLKVPITGAYTLADWSYDEHYAKGIGLGSAGGARQAREAARRRFVLAIARNLVRPNLEALLAAGADWIQLDEPAALTHPEEVPLFVEAFNQSVAGLAGRFTIHICFSDYRLLFPHIDRLENCWGLHIGFANYDSTKLGTRREDRPGYETLYALAGLEHRFNIGLGVLDIHRDT